MDSHTEGEPTRVVFEGLPVDFDPHLDARSLCARLDARPGLRRALVDEPRGSSALVAVVLAPPRDPATIGRALFCNNIGWLPMCVHATIGLANTLAHLGRLPARADGSPHRLETPAGEVRFRRLESGRVEVENVPSRRTHAGVLIETSHGPVVGDIAWGGNWFFICTDSPVTVMPTALPQLTALALEIRAGLAVHGRVGSDGAPIDHIQLCGPPSRADAEAKNFVLCPGGEHDRSPCGTGTSARIACLAAAGELAEGEPWRQESITGTLFDAHYRRRGDEILPTVVGRAFLTAQGHLLYDPRDEIGGFA